MNIRYPSALKFLDEAVERGPDRPAIHFLDATLTYGELRTAADDFALGLLSRGFSEGGRVALSLQNVPEFVAAVLGTWRAGGIVVPLNVMYTASEVRDRLSDSGATAIVGAESVLAAAAGAGALDVDGLSIVVAVPDGNQRLMRDPPGRSSNAAVATEGSPSATGGQHTFGWDDFLPAPHVIGEGRSALATRMHPEVAMFCYTSGTTGPAKAAQNTHANVVASANLWKHYMALTSDDVVLAIAPLFHITGFMGHMVSALIANAPLVLFDRFEPALALRMTDQWKATFTVGPITAFLSILECSDFTRSKLASLSKVVSGGAPVPPAVAERFELETGHYMHNAYGLTESTSLCIGVPLGGRAPVDDEFHALSVGMAAPGTEVAIVDSIEGTTVEDGRPGEILIRGPQVVPGYYGKPEETSQAIRGGWLYTGDVGRQDDLGWVYVVDRIKDLIIASGYKIWPREVEDVLHSHPAVREAAVVGVPDEYRGETVKAFVSLRSPATPSELIEYCRGQLAAYKYPRIVEILEEIPKTATGKYLRRQLK